MVALVFLDQALQQQGWCRLVWIQVDIMVDLCLSFGQKSITSALFHAVVLQRKLQQSLFSAPPTGLDQSHGLEQQGFPVIGIVRQHLLTVLKHQVGTVVVEIDIGLVLVNAKPVPFGHVFDVDGRECLQVIKILDLHFLDLLLKFSLQPLFLLVLLEDHTSGLFEDPQAADALVQDQQAHVACIDPAGHVAAQLLHQRSPEVELVMFFL